MKAVVCTKYGPPDVLRIMDIPKPEPKSNEILIRVLATSVTVADTRVRGFNIPPSYRIPARLALGLTRPRRNILGAEFAGEVVKTGAKVKNFNIGDKVFGTSAHKFGAYAEFMCIPANSRSYTITTIPEKIDSTESAAIPLGGLTALYFLQAAKLTKDEDVLIYGASGSVGTYAVQLAKYFGVRTTAVCSTRNIELVESLGADRVIDYTSENFAREIENYDIVFEAVGKTNLEDCIKVLKSGGRFLHAVAVPAITRKAHRLCKQKRIKFIGGGPKEAPRDLNFLKELVDGEKLKPVIDRTYPLDKIADAHRYVDTGRKKGNVVITL